MLKKKILPFSEILDAIITSMNCSNVEFSEYLKKKNVFISEKRISEYRNRTTNISYPRAREMLNAINYKVSEQELIQSIEENENIIKSMNYQNETYLKSGIRINLRSLLDNENQPEKVKVILEERIEYLFGKSKGKLNTYIGNLIKKDLEKFILERDDKNDRGNSDY